MVKPETGEAKEPFQIDSVMERVAAAVESLPKAVLFELYEEGYSSPFEQLVACILSIRTREEVTGPAARRLFAEVRTPSAMLALSEEELEGRIGTVTFHGPKARSLREISRRVMEDYGGELPCRVEALLGLPGVGPKCAHLVLGIACGEPRVGVDVHVHRVTNRWGIIRTATPEQSTVALEEVLPRKFWVEINRVLVPFGRNVCTGRLPHCSTCPVLTMCRQVGVKEHR